MRRVLEPVVFGDAAMALPKGVERVDVTKLAAIDRKPGKPTRAGGRAQFGYLLAAIEEAKAGRLDALCTAPVSKEQIAKAGIPFVGHTEVLAQAFEREVLMLMAGPRLKVALATNHLPLSKAGTSNVCGFHW